MAYYWAIKWKSYSVEDLYVNDKQKEYIENEWVKPQEHRKSQVFKLGGETYSYNSIDSITKTTKRIEEDVKLLYASQATMNSRAPLMNDDGEIITNWFKKLVSTKEYHSYYASHPSYITLDREDNGVWIAMRLAERENGERPNTVELCSEGECDRLWAYQPAH